jgi:type II secretory pathway component PulF
MPSYYFRAYDQHGGRIDGDLEASSNEEALQLLAKRQLVVVSIKKRDSGSSQNIFTRKNVSLDELEFITSELAILLQNGVRIDKSLDILKRNKPAGPAANMLLQLHSAVKHGKTLSDAMMELPEIFDVLYVSLVRLGEASGDLAHVFIRLSQDLKFRSALRRKVIQSLAYPFVILLVCVSCILFIFNYIVPQMSGLFDGLPEIPVYTAILLGVSHWMQSYQWFLAILIFIAGASIIYALKSKKRRVVIDEMVLKLPFLKNALLIVERIRFNSALAMMLEAGISVDKAMELSVGCVRNRTLRQGLIAAKEHIKKGAGLTSSLAQSPIYPDFFLSLLEVGEESGKLAPVFEEISSRSRMEFESWTDKMTSLLEPLLILAMGGIVGTVVVVMLLSIVSVNDVGF